MAANTAPIFPVTPIIGIANVTTSNSAITSRAPITGTTGLQQLTATSANGTRVDAVMVTATPTSSTDIAMNVFVWMYNGTTSYLYNELPVTAIQPTATVAAFNQQFNYSNLVVPPTYQLYVSGTGVQNFNAFALGGQY